jgi:hypothetical protein
MARELELIYGDALAELGVTGPDRVVSAEDGAEMARVYSSVWYLLEELGLASWDIDGPIPNAAVVPLTWVLAYHAAQPFGITGERMARLKLNGEINGPQPSGGERLLRKLATPPYFNEPSQVVDY